MLTSLTQWFAGIPRSAASAADRTAAAMTVALRASPTLNALITSLSRELNRDPGNAVLRQTPAELQGAVGLFDFALAMHATAAQADQSLARRLSVPQFDLARTLTVLCAVSNTCNINCQICETQVSKATKGNMDFALVQSVIDQWKTRGIASIVLHHVNEPLLHPRIFDILLYLEDAGLSATISTNGNEMRSVLRRTEKQPRLPRALREWTCRRSASGNWRSNCASFAAKWT